MIRPRSRPRTTPDGASSPRSTTAMPHAVLADAVAAHALAVAVVPEQEQLAADQAAEQQPVGQPDRPVVGEPVDDGACTTAYTAAPMVNARQNSRVSCPSAVASELPDGPVLGHVLTVSRWSGRYKHRNSESSHGSDVADHRAAVTNPVLPGDSGRRASTAPADAMSTQRGSARRQRTDVDQHEERSARWRRRRTAPASDATCRPPGRPRHRGRAGAPAGRWARRAPAAGWAAAPAPRRAAAPGPTPGPSSSRMAHSPTARRNAANGSVYASTTSTSLAARRRT